MSHENTNWGQSVAGVLIRDNKVLLARHTYGKGKGLLIIPGGYVNVGETPQDAVKREFLEETGVEVVPGNIIGIRFNMHDWYVVFRVDYVSGTAVSDHEVNSEVLWVDVQEALLRDDVPELSKSLIRSASVSVEGLKPVGYAGNENYNPSSLYCEWF